MHTPEELTENEPAPTGALSESQEQAGTYLVVYPFRHYEIVIRLTADGHFSDIVEVRVRKDLRDYLQRITPSGHPNVESHYD